MKKTILLLMLSASLAFSQDLQKTITLQVSTNDLEVLKLIVNDYNHRLIRTNIDYKYTTNDVPTVVTNEVPVYLGGPIEYATNAAGEVVAVKTNVTRQILQLVTTNYDNVVTVQTNITVFTNGVWYDTVEQFYVDRILPLVLKYHEELLRVTVRDYNRSKQ